MKEMKRMDAEAIRAIDSRILELAKYAASSGGRKIPLRKHIGERFRDFKSMIMRKEATIEELEELVLNRYGDPDYLSPTLEDLGLREHTSEDLSRMPISEITLDCYPLPKET